MNKYLNLVLKSILELKEKGKYEQALETIRQELESNYITKEFTDIFENLYNDIILLDKNRKFEKRFMGKNKEQIITYIFKDYKIDLFAIHYLLDNFSKEINKNDLEKFNAIFLSDKSNNDKIQVLSLIHSFNIDKITEFVFDYKNISSNKIDAVCLKNNILFNDNSYFVSVKELIKKQLFKNPSSVPLCFSIIQAIHENVFPNIPKWAKEELAIKTINYVNNFFKGKNNKKNTNDKEFTSFIENILKNSLPIQQS